MKRTRCGTERTVKKLHTTATSLAGDLNGRSRHRSGDVSPVAETTRRDQVVVVLSVVSQPFGQAGAEFLAAGLEGGEPDKFHDRESVSG